MTDQTAPLAGLRVLDLSRVLAGPWCSQLLADLGAEVIKVERPGAGDETRAWGPPYLPDAAGNDTTEAAYYCAVNRNKKSLTLDLASADGQRIVRELAAKSDVLLENYKVGGLDKYGLDYASLAQLNPRLVYCSITGFGRNGPWADRPGYDFIIQGIGGLMSVTGEADGRPGGGPQKVGVALVDILTGLYAANAVQAALLEREKSGLGQHIDLALLDTEVASLANLALNYLCTGRSPVRMGNAHPNIAPYQVLPAADGHFIVAVGNDGQFRRLCEVMDLAALAADPRFSTNAERVRHRAALDARLEARAAQRGKRDWLAALEAAGVPCGPINSIGEAFAEAQLAAREMVVELPHPTAGTAKLVGNPIKLSRTPVAYRNAPPLLGEHSDEVLREVLGYGEDEIGRLRDAGIV
ncbi:CaiB/BaiF CoA transferase family protein [Azospira restricta]|uniref:CoA transferase n=1 Tax=Azospira restricta TaxID=404405 RepID=A0A974PW84_9RHOO|nr:CaiB/BaiF CoA-transferase family protein [Azospira restricta]QRJ62594.1 CoA transferase [Azospira restricta]